MKNKMHTIEENILEKNIKALSGFSERTGTGITAGLFGTAAITLSRWIDAKLTGSVEEESPAIIAEKLLGIKVIKEKDRRDFSAIVHWLYGSGWGIGRTLISMSGAKGLKASALHGGAIWSLELLLLPYLKAAKPISRMTLEQVLRSTVHIGIYAFTTGVVFDTLRDAKNNKSSIKL